jgi:hypothetical protein
VREFRRHESGLVGGTDIKLDWTGPHFEYLRFYAESFYYFAWRFCSVAKLIEVEHNGQTVQPFKTLKCVGIRSARNRLTAFTVRSHRF